MGKTMQRAQVTNAVQRINAEQGLIDKKAVKSASANFLVDTGAAMICLPIALIEELELTTTGEKPVQTANGLVRRRTFSPVILNVMEREVYLEVMELPNDAPPLMGYLALEALDFIVNPKSQTLEGNPEHDGKWIVDLF